jgi:hypothetical protein
MAVQGFAILNISPSLSHLPILAKLFLRRKWKDPKKPIHYFPEVTLAVTQFHAQRILVMDRRCFLRTGGLGLMGLGVLAEAGCRGQQTAHVVQPGENNLVGSHAAGAETYRPLVDQTVSELLARHSHGIQPAGFTQGASPGGPMRICFIGVENKSVEEIGDFKDQLYEQIDGRIVQSQVYQPVSRRFVEAALRESRLRPDELFIPQNMRIFTARLEQMGQPFDFLLYATLTSGTTRSNKDTQRNYLLTLEMINVRTGQPEKVFCEIDKKYDASARAKLRDLGR